MDTERDRLEQAYRATTYFVDAPDARTAIRIGQTNAAIDALVGRDGATCWAYITAHNPGSHLLTVEENQERHAALELMPDASGKPCYPGESVGDAGEWPAEKGLLIVGITEADAMGLGRQFGQAAIVVGTKGQPPRLVWLDNRVGVD